MDKPSVKKINGKNYLYAREAVYIDKGNIKQKYKSLGRAGSPFDIGKKWEEFKKHIIEFEIKERTVYWSEKVKNTDAFQYIPIGRLEELRTNLYRGKEELGYLGTQAMETAFAIDFIYNSNKIEGSRLPKQAVKERVTNGKGNDEVVNTIKAIEFFNNQLIPCSNSLLLKGQSILLAHDKGNQGFRKDHYVVGDSEVLDYKKIKEELNNLCEWYKLNEGIIYPPELAFMFHYKFERIHPFPDGNGRVGRILMNAILKKHRYHPIIVWDSRRVAYFSAFKKAMEGRGKKYIKFMTDQYIETYEIYIKKIGKAASIDEQISTFLQPSK